MRMAGRTFADPAIHPQSASPDQSAIASRSVVRKPPSPIRSLFVFLVLLLLQAPRHLVADDRSFIIGVMRRDGVIVPFAAHNGKRWSNQWPAPRLELQIPITLEGIPKSWWGPAKPAGEWQLWTPDAGTATVHVRQPDWIDAHCLRQIGLKTDYHSPQAVPPPTDQPYPKDGLAVAPPQTIRPIEIVPLGTASRLFADVGVRDRFNAAERETALRFGHPIGRRAREAVEPIIEAVYGFGDNPRAYYVEASRMYRKLGDGGCTTVAFGTGWLLELDRRPKWADFVVDLLPCNKYGATYMLPLGAFRLDDRVFWTAQYSGWDHERYVVVEIKKDRVEASVTAWGGGC
jgi:hypothetical protein